MAVRDDDALEILTPEQMGMADRLTIDSGIAGYALMEAAGEAVAKCAMALFESKSGSDAYGQVCILCGPGNNGGDGFVAGQLLEEEGWSVVIGCSVGLEDLKGDARLAADDWGDEIFALTEDLWEDSDLVIDALFGAGLDRPIGGELADLIDALNESDVPVLSVDLPSGVEGASGHVGGAAVKADRSVTFFRKKPGHLLYPGKAFCGVISCEDIGIEEDVLEETGFSAAENAPSLWLEDWPEALKPIDMISPSRLADHKFRRGHCLVLCGDAIHSGAARLSARAALRAGAGLVTLAPPLESAPYVAGQVTSVMMAPIDDSASLGQVLAGRNFDVLLAGPALGLDDERRRLALSVLDHDLGLVLDADALSGLAKSIELGEADLTLVSDSPSARAGRLLLTPHEGEFARLFPDLSHRLRAEKGLSKIDCAKMAAERCGAAILLKGADSVIAGPEGQVVVHSSGVPYLATAGSGDVLAGIVAGLMAQGMPVLEAASAAVWLHSRAGLVCGAGLISEDLVDCLPRVYKELFEAGDPDEDVYDD